MSEETVQFSVVDDGQHTSLSIKGTPYDLVAMLGYIAVNDENVFGIIMSTAEALKDGVFDDAKQEGGLNKVTNE